MAATLDAAARRILSVFQKMALKSGQAAGPQSFASAFSSDGFDVADFDAGSKHAAALGWVTISEEGSLRLTHAGAQEI